MVQSGQLISGINEDLLYSTTNSLSFRYDVVIASDVARTRTNGCIFFKLRDPSVDVLPSHYYSHKFVCVAPYSTDTLLLINIPKTMLEKVIKVSTSCCCCSWCVGGYCITNTNTALAEKHNCRGQPARNSCWLSSQSSQTKVTGWSQKTNSLPILNIDHKNIRTERHFCSFMVKQTLFDKLSPSSSLLSLYYHQHPICGPASPA